MSTDGPARIKTLDHTLDILDALVELDGGGVSRIAERVDLSKGAVHKHLATLADRGYLVRGPGDTYDLSVSWLRYGGYARSRSFPIQRVQTAVWDIATETGELALFSTLSGGASMPVYHARGEHAVTTDSYSGNELPVHCTASGKAMLAAADDPEQILAGTTLRARTERTVTDRATLRQDLEEIRAQGFALEDQERIDGMRGIGVAVTNDLTGEVLGSVAITGPTHRIQGERFHEQFPQLVRNRVRELELNVTHERG